MNSEKFYREMTAKEVHIHFIRFVSKLCDMGIRFPSELCKNSFMNSEVFQFSKFSKKSGPQVPKIIQVRLIKDVPQ